MYQHVNGGRWDKPQALGSEIHAEVYTAENLEVVPLKVEEGVTPTPALRRGVMSHQQAPTSTALATLFPHRLTFLPVTHTVPERNHSLCKS